MVGVSGGIEMLDPGHHVVMLVGTIRAVVGRHIGYAQQQLAHLGGQVVGLGGQGVLDGTQLAAAGLEFGSLVAPPLLVESADLAGDGLDLVAHRIPLLGGGAFTASGAARSARMSITRSNLAPCGERYAAESRPAAGRNRSAPARWACV